MEDSVVGQQRETSWSPADRLTAWIMKWPLGIAIFSLCLVQLATWIPHYLTWPFFVDHEVFANLALQWNSGLLPYRDSSCNNFPGSIYLFWILGKVFGWGTTSPLFAVDATLLAMFGGVMITWSSKVFSRLLPGIIGYASFLSYYLNLDCSLVAQRDWHGPLLAIVGILILECAASWRPLIFSSLLIATGFVIRPQIDLLLPAVFLAIIQLAHRSRRSVRTVLIYATLWSALCGFFVILWFAPVFAADIWSDFLRGIKIVAYGAHYNQVSFLRILKQLLLQAAHIEYILIPIAIGLMAANYDERTSGTTIIWLVALCGVWLYKPLSPVPWPYLSLPLVLLTAINVSILVNYILNATNGMPTLQFVAVLLILIGSGVELRPRYCSVERSLSALRSVGQATVPVQAPLGYLGFTDTDTQQTYPWKDYRDVLIYLRHTKPETRLMNLLRVAPALIGPTGRRSALPAESLAWLVVRPEDTNEFIRALKEAREDALIVWAPLEEHQDDQYRLASEVRRLAPTIHRDFEREAQFGVIEVWHRKSHL